MIESNRAEKLLCLTHVSLKILFRAFKFNIWYGKLQKLQHDIFNGPLASKLIQKFSPTFLIIWHKVQQLDVFLDIPSVFRKVFPIPAMGFHFLYYINFNILISLDLIFFIPTIITQVFLVGRFLIVHICKPHNSTNKLAFCTACTICSWKILVNHCYGHIISIDLFLSGLFILIGKGF